MSYQEIKQAALREFAAKGYDATTLKDIASKVGIKTPSIYFYCASKHDLFVDVWRCLMVDVEHFFEDISGRIACGIEGDEVELLKEIFHRIFIYFKNYPCRFAFIQRMNLDLQYVPIHEIFAEGNIASHLYTRAKLDVLLDRCKDKKIFINVPNEEIFLMFYSVLAGYLNQTISYKIEVREEQLDFVVEVLIKGLNP